MTKLTYLQDSYLFESTARILKLSETDKGLAISLDSTIFYPQGGGQPADTGEISCGDRLFNVTDVRIDENGTVWHYGEFVTGEFVTGEFVTGEFATGEFATGEFATGEFATGEFKVREKVQLKIDQEQRILHARLHSAGHLLDCAVYKLNLKELKPIKGFHFAAGSHVEYEGIKENFKEMIPELQKTVDELIEQDLALEKLDLSAEEASAQELFAPLGKFVRVVNFRGYPNCGCGGTHINSSKEIGKITIRKIKIRQGRTRVSYSIEEKK